MRNALLMLGAVTTAVASIFAADGMAQSGTVIYWKIGGISREDPSTNYKVLADGTNNLQYGVYPTSAINPSALTNYPGGRRLFSVERGATPESSQHLDIVLRAEQNAPAIRLTDFRGPDYLDVQPSEKWSSERLDSFFAFQAHDMRTGGGTLYRYDGPMSNLSASDFVPFVTDDPRLTKVTALGPRDTFCGFDSTGTKSAIMSPAAWGKKMKSPAACVVLLAHPPLCRSNDRKLASRPTTDGHAIPGHRRNHFEDLPAEQFFA